MTIPAILPHSSEPDRAPVVVAKDGGVFADSRDVAEFFGKRHTHVLDAIRDLLAKEPPLAPNFRPFKINDLTGETTSHVEMDRRGFTVLVMGFTGEKALKWKLRWIDAFDFMEAELRNRPAVDPMAVLNDAAAMRGLLLTYSEKVLALEKANADMQPKVEALDRIAGAVGSMCISTAAKTLGVNPIKNLFALLQARRWIFKRPNTSGWLAHQDKIQSGYLEHTDHLYIDSLGQERVNSRVMVTAKGLVKIADLLTQKPQ